MGFVKEMLIDKGISGVIAGYLSFSIELIILIIICLLANFITKRVVLNIISRTVYKNSIKWDDFLVERKVFHRISNIVPFVIIYISAPIFGSFEEAIQRTAQAIILVISVLVISAILNAIDDVYKTYPISKIRPITGTLQIVKILACILIGIALAATLSGTNPIAILSGIGVLSALVSIIFKDPILGFVAGVQLTTNDMIRIGDWVEMTKYGANGHVVEIHLSTIEIYAFATDIDLKKYEKIQSDIFDHLFAVINEFQLRVFQNPSEYDIKQISKIL